MTHLWVRAEQRVNERRVGLMPQGAAELIAKGFRITIEQSADRVVDTEAYVRAGCELAPRGSWPDAPADAFVLGLKELPEDGRPLRHRHIMFGHAFKGQPAGRALLKRFAAGGGVLLDLEYLTDATGRRVAAFGYWAGFVGAAVSLRAWAAQACGDICDPVDPWPDSEALVDDVSADLNATLMPRPKVIVIGALGRVGSGAIALCEAVGAPVTRWDLAETARGEPFPEVLEHAVFLNCILATPGCPVFVPATAAASPRNLRVIGDIACDPTSAFSPVRVYDRVTSWADPVLRVHAEPPLDVMAIDNLPSLLPLESSQDFAAQLLPHLAALDGDEAGVWGRAEAVFRKHIEG